MLNTIEEILWEYIAIFVILFISIFFTIKSRFFQIKTLFRNNKLMDSIESSQSRQGIHPLKLFFASTGGMIGLGNITSISDSLVKGGPGVLFWMIIGSFLGMIIKYCEIYLGVETRKYNQEKKEYYGGPVNFIQSAFNSKILVWLFVVLFLIYSIEIYQFNVLIEQAENMTSYSKTYWMIVLLILVASGGFNSTKVLVNICSYMMPFLFILYFGLFIFIMIKYYFLIPKLIYEMFYYAFHPYAAAQGFAGASVIYTIHQALKGVIYSGDIGIGYDSTIQSNTSLQKSSIQGKISILSLMADTFICLQTVFMIYLTSYWQQKFKNSNTMMLTLISDHIYYGEIFYTLIVFISAFTTIICFLNVGKKLAFQIGGKYFEYFYQILAVSIFIFFSYYSIDTARLIMGISAGILVILNLTAILKLQNKIKWV